MPRRTRAATEPMTAPTMRPIEEFPLEGKTNGSVSLNICEEEAVEDVGWARLLVVDDSPPLTVTMVSPLTQVKPSKTCEKMEKVPRC